MKNSIEPNHFILADGRWTGPHGIGRFSREILSRLQYTDILTEGPKPLSIKNLFWQSQQLYRYRKNYKIFFSPGFNPVIYSPIPFVFTIHDLIHLFAPGNISFPKKIYYQFLIKPAITRAYKILTISDYSKKTILEWANVPEDKIINVSCGINECFTREGLKHTPGYPYLLHVGNTQKPHKNISRLLQAFSSARINENMRLIFTGEFSETLFHLLHKLRLENKIIIQKNLSEPALAEYYRGAEAVVFPSLYEGFGLPVAEGMASGVPVLTSNVTSMPEVAGDAALLVDPFDVGSISAGIEKIVNDAPLRKQLVERGLERAKLFSWDKTAEMTQRILNLNIW
ncbi:MAG TPA: glycosyltransferase family 1 protein [Gammaproteobacteria bacterium]|nr:glycosyltransferase family 1 protein [Gammaproteobacteria bacterium]